MPKPETIRERIEHVNVGDDTGCDWFIKELFYAGNLIPRDEHEAAVAAAVLAVNAGGKLEEGWFTKAVAAARLEGMERALELTVCHFYASRAANAILADIESKLKEKQK